jgi:antitoxin component YwqK of YwqJK toxin-antitoxin module
MNFSKYYIVVLCISSVFFFSCSEREIQADQLQKRGELYYAVNEEDPYSGKAIENYQNGQKKSEKNYSDGMLSGLFIKWAENGQKLEESNYKDGLLNGLSMTWKNNGEKYEEINYVIGKKNGIAIQYSDGHKWIEQTYKDDQLDGLYLYWSDNEQKSLEKKYKNGVLDGPYTEFYENGYKRLEKIYVNGKIDGLSVRWSEDGKKIREKNYKGGEGISPWAYYDADGERNELNFIENNFKLVTENLDPYDDIVYDESTGLMWERFGSRKHMTFTSAKSYVDELNQIKFGGYNNWRLPTIEEAFTLLESTKLEKWEKYFDAIFCKPTMHGNYTSPHVIWTVNEFVNIRWVLFYVDGAWNINEDEPGMNLKNSNDKVFVKAVRTM